MSGFSTNPNSSSLTKICKNAIYAKHSSGKGDPQTFRRDDDEKLLHIQEDAFIAQLGEGPTV